MPTLVYKLDHDEERHVEVGSEPLTVGCRSGCDVCVPNSNLSHLHARLEWLGDRLLLIDLGSEAGTRVNGVRVSCEEVHVGDRLTLGSLEMTVVESPARTLAVSKGGARTALDRKLAEVAHELRNPLNFITNFAQVSAEIVLEIEEELELGLSSDVLAAVRAKLAMLADNSAKIREHGRRADAIIQQILDRARGLASPVVAAELNALVADCVRSMTEAGGAPAGLRVDERYDRSIGPQRMIELEIRRVVINILDNAFHALKQKQRQAGAPAPELMIATRKLEDAVELRVRDNGVGIRVEDQARVFEPLFTTRREGLGLGLALSREVADAHGGELRVESEPGQYAQVVLTLPLGDAAPG